MQFDPTFDLNLVKFFPSHLMQNKKRLLTDHSRNIMYDIYLLYYLILTFCHFHKSLENFRPIIDPSSRYDRSDNCSSDRTDKVMMIHKGLLTGKFDVMEYVRRKVLIICP